MVVFLKKHEPTYSIQIGAKIQKKKRCMVDYALKFWSFALIFISLPTNSYQVMLKKAI